MATQQRAHLANRTAVRAMRPARVALVLEVEYRRAKRDLRTRRRPTRSTST